MSQIRLYAKTSMLILLVMSLFFTVAIPINMVRAPVTPTVGLDPRVIIDTTLVPGETFEVNVTITDVTDLYDYEFELDWYPFPFLNTTIANVTEGDFLKQGGTTDFYVEIVPTYGVLLSNTLTGGVTSGVDGNGTLATVKFRVEDRGYAYFEFWYDGYNELRDSGGSTITANWDVGGFRNVGNLFMEPSTTVRNPSDIFSVDLKITNVTDVYGWGITINWKIGLLTFVSATEGPFLKSGGGTYFAPPVDDASSVLLGCNLQGAVPGVNAGWGSETLATVDLRVEVTGNSTLNLSDTKLVNSTGGLMTHTWQDGYFYTTRPVSDFTWSPAPPIYPAVDETVTFNATASFDPLGGTITSYTWDFGDGTGKFTESDPFIDHIYGVAKPYYVKLNVTDDDGEWWETTKTLTIVTRDVAVIDVTTSHTVAMAGTIVSVNATVENIGGGMQETFNVTAYYDTSAIGKNTTTLNALQNKTLTFEWNTTGVPIGEYTIKALADIVSPYEANKTNNELIDGKVIISTINVITKQVKIGGVTFYYVIESNSSVTNIAFNQTAKEISFNATGPGGTVGFFNVTIPMTLLNASSPDDWIVKMDDAPLAFTATSNGTHYFVYATYDHSNHKFQIIGTSVATAPIASFTTVTTAYTHQIITFNATDSYDPDGTIVKYNWDFADGTTANETVAITTHYYLYAATYKVILTVTDNQGLNATAWKDVSVSWLVDVSVLDVTVSQNTVKYGESLFVNVTVKNEGDIATTFNVTAYYNSSIIEEQTVTNLNIGANQTLTFVWFATGVSVGTYTIKATAEAPGDLDTSDDTLVYGEVTIEKMDSTVSLAASRTAFNYGGNTSLTVSITPQRAEAFVTIWYNLDDGDWKKLRMAVTDENSEYTYMWIPATAGIYELKASWTGDVITKTAESANVTVTVAKLTSTLTIEVSTTSINTGQTVTIGGQLLPLNVGVNVTIHIRSNGGDWKILDTVITNEMGRYMYTWTPSQGGTYELKASWLGAVNTLAAESDTKTVSVQEPFPNVYILAIVGGVAVVIAIILAYWFKFRKSKRIRSVGKS